ncbi:MAG: hypothetical protein ACAI38_17825 [Myxococcota bacterium]|nr:hypothetical protein [Myxococcota bacterium]
MGSPIDKSHAFQPSAAEMQRLGLRLLPVDEAIAQERTSGARMHSGGYGAAVSGGAIDRMERTGRPPAKAGEDREAVWEILRTQKATALGRRMRAQADDAAQAAGKEPPDMPVGFSLEAALPGRPELRDLYFWFDTEKLRPRVGPLDRANGTFEQIPLARSRALDTSKLQQALERIIEDALDGRIDSVKIRTAPQFSSH